MTLSMNRLKVWCVWVAPLVICVSASIGFAEEQTEPTEKDCVEPLPPITAEMPLLNPEERALIVSALRLEERAPHPLCSFDIRVTSEDEEVVERYDPWTENDDEWEILLVDGKPPTKRQRDKERRYRKPFPPHVFWDRLREVVEWHTLAVESRSEEAVTFIGTQRTKIKVRGEWHDDMIHSIEIVVDPDDGTLKEYNLEVQGPYKFSAILRLIEAVELMNFDSGQDIDFPQHTHADVDLAVRVTVFRVPLKYKVDISNYKCPLEKMPLLCESSTQDTQTL